MNSLRRRIPQIYHPRLLSSALASHYRTFSNTTKTSHSTKHSKSEEDKSHPPTQDFNVIQTCIQSRRTISYFQSSDQNQNQNDNDNDKLSQAIHRAIQCGITAPNHKRTEPTTFKILKSPSIIESLSQIVYQQTLQQQIQPNHTPHQTHHHTHHQTQDFKQAALQKAEKKRHRWRHDIPLYIAVLVNHQPHQSSTSSTSSTSTSTSSTSTSTSTSSHQNDNHDNNHHSLYQPLPFIPPQTERQLEDVSAYSISHLSCLSCLSCLLFHFHLLIHPFTLNEQYACACAAIQNIQLSLHSEQDPRFGCKWATGNIIHTPAFRNLIHAQHDQRVVGLLMVGIPDDKHLQRLQNIPRRFRRPLPNDVLQIL